MDGVIIMRPFRLALTQRVRFMSDARIARPEMRDSWPWLNDNQPEMDSNDDASVSA